MNKIHPTAIVHKDTKIHESVEIGPYSVIGPEVDLDKGNIIDCHVVIKGPSKFGQKNTFFPYSLVGEATPDLKYRGEKSLLNVGENNVFREFSKVHRGTAADLGFTQIGNNNLIMPGVMVAHDCILGDRNILVDNSALAGHVVLGDNVTLGGYTLVHQYCKIGSYAFTGMGSQINMDVAAFTRVAGNPTKVAGLNSVGLERKSFSRDEIQNLKKAYKIFFREKKSVKDALSAIKSECFSSENIDIFTQSIKNSTRGVMR